MINAAQFIKTREYGKLNLEISYNPRAGFFSI